jgi:hypothetical protein
MISHLHPEIRDLVRTLKSPWLLQTKRAGFGELGHLSLIYDRSFRSSSQLMSEVHPYCFIPQCTMQLCVLSKDIQPQSLLDRYVQVHNPFILVSCQIPAGRRHLLWSKITDSLYLTYERSSCVSPTEARRWTSTTDPRQPPPPLHHKPTSSNPHTFTCQSPAAHSAGRRRIQLYAPGN